MIEGIRRERRMMSTLRAAADMVIDTSSLNVHQLQQRVAHAYGMGEEQVLLQLGRIRRRHVGRGQVPEPGGHAVDDLPRGDQTLDHLARLDHAGPRFVAEPHRRAAPGHGLDVGDREVRAGQHDVLAGRERPAQMLRLGQMAVGAAPRGRWVG